MMGAKRQELYLRSDIEKNTQTGLLVRTIMDELEYFIYSGRRKNAELRRLLEEEDIVSRMNRGLADTESRSCEGCELTGKLSRNGYRRREYVR